MKKIFLAFLCATGLCYLNQQQCFSQSNLQFNQVINQAVTSSTCYTVPSGKAFRLEAITDASAAAIYLEFGSTCGAVDYGRIYISNVPIHAGVNTSGNPQSWPFPIWFKAGSYISATSGTIYISGIELNLVP